MDILSFFYIIVLLAVLIIGILSFTLFIKRLLINTTMRNNHSKEIELKLDRIIDLLEKDSK
jgi:hypothetical protein